MSRCPKCRALTADADHYCRRCGTRLDQPPQAVGLRIFWLLLVGLAAGAAFLFWVTPERSLSPLPSPQPADPGEEIPQTAPLAALPAASKPSAQAALLPFPSVWVRVSDASGREIAALPAPVVGAGWVALPRQEVLGGALWEAELPDGQRVPISAGVQADTDVVGLWQLDAIGDLRPPPLAAWEPGAPIVWRPLASDDLFPVRLQEGCTPLIHFEHCPGGAAPATTGILLQDQRVVGWTFDKRPSGHFLWTSATGDRLQPTLRVNDFYRLSFEDGREERLLLAMENADLTTAERLAALADAFGRDPRLADTEQRALFDEAPARARLHQLVDILLANGQALTVADSFESRILAQIADPALIGKVATAGLTAYGAAYALTLMEEVLYWSPAGGQADGLEVLYHDVAVQALKSLAAEEDVAALQVRLPPLSERFSDSAAIYLFRVEAALLAGEIALADDLLAAGTYPAALQERATALAARIDEAAALAEGILIPFTPGSTVIETEARLNGLLRQLFVVDTGATLTTIPTAAAERLGLSAGAARRRQVTTAGGTVTAWEARLESVILADVAVTDLTVLVLDIPDNPDLGLLGMNFIRNFEMDLDNQKGQLVLRPR